MATQGIVSVLRGTRVVAKLICGCNGYNACDVADEIKRHPGLSALGLYDLALGAGLGCEDCLVVMTESETVCEDADGILNLYRETFGSPCFNPRWWRGDGANVALAFWPKEDDETKDG